jgi:hypothetical protein
MVKLVKKIVMFSSVLFFSAGAFAEYKINISSPVLNDKALLKSGTSLVPFDETGTSGNIALIGTNGITASSITSNADSRDTDNPIAALLDGYQNDSLPAINSSSSGSIKDGFFNAVDYQNTNRWFSIDLGKVANISGFKIFSYSTQNASRNPRNVIIQSSVDGISFDNEEFFTLPEFTQTSVINMASAFSTRYFRFHVVDSYHGRYLIFGEIEVFQTQE